jgi:hypothetical protein
LLLSQEQPEANWGKKGEGRRTHFSVQRSYELHGGRLDLAGDDELGHGPEV